MHLILVNTRGMGEFEFLKSVQKWEKNFGFFRAFKSPDFKMLAQDSFIANKCTYIYYFKNINTLSKLG